MFNDDEHTHFGKFERQNLGDLEALLRVKPAHGLDSQRAVHLRVEAAKESIFDPELEVKII